MSVWLTLGAISPTLLTEARIESHQAAQWLARATRAYCTPVKDDSHTSLTWDSSAHALVTQTISKDLRLGLRLTDLTLLVRNGNNQSALSLPGKKNSEISSWLKNLLSQHHLDPKRLDEPGPYALAPHPLDKGKPFGFLNTQPFEELDRYYSNAALLLETVRQTQAHVSPVRCWPHHFDMATLIALDTEEGEGARSIGVGVSPGDDTYPDPYFYISPWPYPVTRNLPDVVTPAFWHREGFTAVILSSNDVVAVRDHTQQRELVASVLRNGIEIVRKLFDT